MDSPKRSLYKILFDSASSLSDPKTAFCERDPIKSSVADDVKDVSLFLKTVSNGQDTHRDMWRLCTKAKDTLGTNGARVENIMWRLMALSLKERKEKEARELEKEQKEKQKPVDTIKSELMEEDEYEAEESLEEEEEEEFVEAVKMEEDSERDDSDDSDFIPKTESRSAPAESVSPGWVSVDNRTLSGPGTEAKSTAKKKKGPRRANPNLECTHCHTHVTPLWRRHDVHGNLCNACGLFLKLHGVLRPLKMRTDVIKNRNRGGTKKSMDEEVTTSSKATSSTRSRRRSSSSAAKPTPPTTATTTSASTTLRRKSSINLSAKKPMPTPEAPSNPLPTPSASVSPVPIPVATRAPTGTISPASIFLPNIPSFPQVQAQPRPRQHQQPSKRLRTASMEEEVRKIAHAVNQPSVYQNPEQLNHQLVALAEIQQRLALITPLETDQNIRHLTSIQRLVDQITSTIAATTPILQPPARATTISSSSSISPNPTAFLDFSQPSFLPHEHLMRNDLLMGPTAHHFYTQPTPQPLPMQVQMNVPPIPPPVSIPVSIQQPVIMPVQQRIPIQQHHHHQHHQQYHQQQQQQPLQHAYPRTTLGSAPHTSLSDLMLMSRVTTTEDPLGAVTEDFFENWLMGDD